LPFIIIIIYAAYEWRLHDKKACLSYLIYRYSYK